jgi:hypothetical protein
MGSTGTKVNGDSLKMDRYGRYFIAATAAAA